MEELKCVNVEKGLRIASIGTCRHCCLQDQYFVDENKKAIIIHDYKFDKILNSYTSLEIKKQLKKGIKHSSCERCWVEEEAGIESKRMRDNVAWTINNKPGINFLDINVTNTCNLKCRTCSVISSSKWNKESIDRLKDIFGFNVIDVQKTVDKVFDDNSIFWDEYKNSLKTIKHIDFYGGEPLLINKQIEILKYAVDNNLSKNISLHFNTNGTVWNIELFKILKEFKRISIDISIDAIEDKAYYIRHPSKWETVFNNIKIINQLDFDVRICCTVSILNIFYIDDVIKFFKNMGIDLWFNLTHKPGFYSVQYLPEPIKKEIEKKISPCLKKHKYDNKIINFMYSKKFNETFWEGFIKETKACDKYRNESFSKTFPEFYKLIKEKGYGDIK